MAHSAPLDIKFFSPSPSTCSHSPDPNEWGSFPCSWNGTALVSFHGSWDRIPPTGYKVVYIPWDMRAGGPVAQNDNRTGYENLLYTAQVEAGGDSSCPNGCIR